MTTSTCHISFADVTPPANSSFNILGLMMCLPMARTLLAPLLLYDAAIQQTNPIDRTTPTHRANDTYMSTREINICSA